MVSCNTAVTTGVTYQRRKGAAPDAATTPEVVPAAAGQAAPAK
jgi:hypothetical protein